MQDITAEKSNEIWSEISVKIGKILLLKDSEWPMFGLTIRNETFFS
jgi:hypothetical protein